MTKTALSGERARAALGKLAAPKAEIALAPGGRAYAVFRGPDRRRRPVAHIAASEVRAWLGQGLLAPLAERDGYVLSAAGRAAAHRQGDHESAYLAQHGKIEARPIMNEDGDVRWARGFDSHCALKRLAALRDAQGRAFFTAEEMAAAARLRQDWEAGRVGEIRGSDWSAPPRGGAARGPGDAVQNAMAAACDARQRVELALARLAAPLRRAVERVCLMEEGVEALERGEGWPARSGKIALKLGLAQLALERDRAP